MEAKHVYMKGLHGWGLFYRIEDILVFLTIYSVLARSMNLVVMSFAIMFNHIHSLFKAISSGTLTSFQLRLSTAFAKEYNKEYGREGAIFNSPFGKAKKRETKTIVSCIAYIFNNPVAGKMCEKAIEYRWNLLAYFNNPCPFSKKLVKRKSRHIMRTALKVVDIYYSEGKALGYQVLRRVFRGLTPEEKDQMVDYIVSKYNFLNYNALFNILGSFDDVRMVVDTIAGNEYDMEDDYGDHSCYRKLIAHSRALGFEGPNYERLSSEQIATLSAKLFRRVNASHNQMRKFLHLPTPKADKAVPGNSQ